MFGFSKYFSSTIVFMGFCASLIPWCKHLWQISMLVGVDGAAMGALDTLGNLAVLSRLKNYYRYNNIKIYH